MTNRIRTRRLVAATGAAGALLVGGMAASAQAATPSATGSSSSASTVLAKIRYCESGNNYRAQNSSSTASGAYQFLDSTWQKLSAGKGYSRAMDAPASVQDAAALELYQSAGTSPWAASQSCWAGLGAVPTTSSSSTSSSTTTSTTSSSATTSTGSTSGTTTASHHGTSRPAPQGKGKPEPRKDARPAPAPTPGDAPKGHHGHRHGAHRPAPAARA